MVLRNIDDSAGAPVEMDGAKDVRMSVMVGRDDGAPHFAMRSFSVSPGGHTPKHAHDYEHEVYIVAGRGEVLLEGQYRSIRQGDVVYVPANEEHQFRVNADSNDPLRFLCLVPVEQNCGGPVPGS